MSEEGTGLRNGVAQGCNSVSSDGNGVASDVTRFDENRLTFDEAGSSATAKRWSDSTTRVRVYRKRKKLGLLVRTARIGEKQVTKLIERGYLAFDSRGDEKAEGIAIEAYLRDSL